MTPLDLLRRRYDHDGEFRALVDNLTAIIEHLRMTPSEVRDAAMFACWRQETLRPRRAIWFDGADEPRSRTSAEVREAAGGCQCTSVPCVRAKTDLNARVEYPPR